MAKKNKRIEMQGIVVSDYAAEGKALAKADGKVIFISGAVPGDTVDLFLTKNKKDWAEARVTAVTQYSKDRVEPFCRHFGVCGGCKWQMLPYEKQLQYKQQEAEQNLRRIGRVTEAIFLPITGADETKYYRNKLEFTFSNKEFMIAPPPPKGGRIEANDFIETTFPIEEIRPDMGNSEPSSNNNTPALPSGGGGAVAAALGFHVPRIFDKVIDIHECYLMDDVNNRIRNTVRAFARERAFSFYDIRQHTGWLRNLIIRYCSTGELMVNLCINHEAEEDRKALLEHLLKEVPEITTLLYTINPKWNDTIYDLEPQVYHGKGYVIEKLKAAEDEVYEFIISPKSFFQTNTKQAEKLYSIARDFAGLTGQEIVYDLYCGTGSIGIFVSKYAKKIIGVEVVADAIEDARKNAAINNVAHAEFFAGDVIKICDDAFFAKHGKPDVVITDPPRAGMHEKLLLKLLEMEAPKIVYVSCNTATQARDLLLLQDKYRVEKVQPVDMFPHTHHIESVALLTLKK